MQGATLLSLQLRTTKAISEINQVARTPRKSAKSDTFCLRASERTSVKVKQNGQAKKDEGISSLRHRLFKDAKTREMLKTAAGGHSSGAGGILAVDPNGVLLLEDD